MVALVRKFLPSSVRGEKICFRGKKKRFFIDGKMLKLAAFELSAETPQILVDTRTGCRCRRRYNATDCYHSEENRQLIELLPRFRDGFFGFRDVNVSVALTSRRGASADLDRSHGEDDVILSYIYTSVLNYPSRLHTHVYVHIYIDIYVLNCPISGKNAKPRGE